MAGKGSGIYIWENSGVGGASIFDEPYANEKQYGGIPVGSIGFDLDGAFNGIVYHWNGQSWVSTTQTVAGFYGV